MLKRREWKARWNRTIGGGKHRWASEDRAVRIPIRPTYGDAAVPFFNRRIEAEEDARGRVRIRDRAGGPAIEPASAQQPLEASDVGGADGKGAVARKSLTDKPAGGRHHPTLKLRGHEEEQMIVNDRSAERKAVLLLLITRVSNERYVRPEAAVPAESEQASV